VYQKYKKNKAANNTKPMIVFLSVFICEI